MPNEFRNLVFEGGGVKGIAYAGALSELEKLKILHKIKRVSGTSAGAITAVLLSLGYSVDELSKIISNKNFNDFKDDSFGVVFDIIRLIRKYGWHKGKNFSDWIGGLIEKKSGKKDLTFKELHHLREKNNFLELYIAGTNLSNQSVEIYSHETEPDMEIRKAVRISMSIPLYFQAVSRKNSIMADGGITLNYPINVFDFEKYLDSEKNGEKVTYNKTPNYVFNHETLGFRLDSRDEILYNTMGWSNVPKKVDNILKYNLSLLSFILETANKKHLHKNDWNRTIFIDTLGVKATDFDLPKDKINALVESGRHGVLDHFKWRHREMKKPD
jgi:NTE family protein